MSSAVHEGQKGQSQAATAAAAARHALRALDKSLTQMGCSRPKQRSQVAYGTAQQQAAAGSLHIHLPAGHHMPYGHLLHVTLLEGLACTHSARTVVTVPQQNA